MRYVCKNPPGGERNPYQLIDYEYSVYLSYLHVGSRLFELLIKKVRVNKQPRSLRRISDEDG